MVTKVAILIPSMSEVKADFALALAGMAAYSAVAGHQLMIINEKSSLITAARNNLVRRAIEMKADYALFLDSDMQFPCDALIRLLKHDKDVVAATYNKRVHPFNTLGVFKGKVDAAQTGLVEAESLPTGLMLIRMGVFRKFQSPWFRETYEESCRTDTNPDGVVGEDTNFCRSVRGAGMKVWCDLDLTYGTVHIGERHVAMSKAA